ncbi:MAG: hypothetical protein ACM358_05470 [Gemmatimonadota bacterium]
MRDLAIRWIRSATWAGFVGLAAYLLATRVFERFGWSVLPVNVIALPGLVLSALLGASVHGAGFGDARDFLVIPLGCGLFWGTIVFGVRLVITKRHPGKQTIP